MYTKVCLLQARTVGIIGDPCLGNPCGNSVMCLPIEDSDYYCMCPSDKTCISANGSFACSDEPAPHIVISSNTCIKSNNNSAPYICMAGNVTAGCLMTMTNCSIDCIITSTEVYCIFKHFSSYSMTSVNGSSMVSVNDSSMVSVNGFSMTSVNGSSMTSVNGSSMTSVNGSSMTSVNGSSMTSVNGSSMAVINGSFMTAVNGIVTHNLTNCTISDRTCALSNGSSCLAIGANITCVIHHMSMSAAECPMESLCELLLFKVLFIMHRIFVH